MRRAEEPTLFFTRTDVADSETTADKSGVREVVRDIL